MRLRSSIVIPGSTKKWFSPDRAKTRLMRRLRCRSRAYRRLAGRCPALGCRHRPCAVCRGFLPFCFLCAISTLAGLPACTSTRHESTAAGSAEGSPGEGISCRQHTPEKFWRNPHHSGSIRALAWPRSAGLPVRQASLPLRYPHGKKACLAHLFAALSACTRLFSARALRRKGTHSVMPM